MIPSLWLDYSSVFPVPTGDPRGRLDTGTRAAPHFSPMLTYINNPAFVTWKLQMTGSARTGSGKKPLLAFHAALITADRLDWNETCIAINSRIPTVEQPPAVRVSLILSIAGNW